MSPPEEQESARRTALLVPTLVLLLLAFTVTLAVWLDPRSLYTLAICVGAGCAGLVAWALLARREAPRNEPPDADELASFVRNALDDGSVESLREALLRLGRWPFSLDAVPEPIRTRLATAVVDKGLDADIRAWTDDPQARTRRMGAVHLLGWLRIPGAEARLEELWAGPYYALSEAAASALVRLGSPLALDKVIERIDKGPLPPSRVAALLENAPGDELLAALARVAPGGAATCRYWIAHLAGRTRQRAALRLLLDLSLDASHDVRANAAESIGALGLEDGRARLHELLTDPSWVVRAHAAVALGQLGAAPSVDRLAELLGDEWWVRERAVRALESAGAAAAPAVSRQLPRLDGDSRRAALDVLRLVDEPVAQTTSS